MTVHKPATPLPWRILHGQDKDGVPRIASKEGGIAILCVNHYRGQSGPSKSEQQNAAYIVAACNAYPKLIEMLRNVSGCYELIDAKEITQALLRSLGELT